MNNNPDLKPDENHTVRNIAAICIVMTTMFAGAIYAFTERFNKPTTTTNQSQEIIKTERRLIELAKNPGQIHPPSFNDLTDDTIIADTIYWIWQAKIANQNGTDYDNLPSYAPKPLNSFDWFVAAHRAMRKTVYNHFFGSEPATGDPRGNHSQYNNTYDARQSNRLVLCDIFHVGLKSPTLVKAVYLAKREIIIDEIKKRVMETEIKEVINDLAPRFLSGTFYGFSLSEYNDVQRWWYVNGRADEDEHFWEEKQKSEKKLGFKNGDTYVQTYEWIGRRFMEGGQPLLDAYAWCMLDLAERL